MRQPQLGAADKVAIDVLLDHQTQTRATPEAGFTVRTQSPVDPHRLDAARALLGNLQYWEASDPPADLVAKTMSRIAHRATEAGASHVSATHTPGIGRLNA